MVTMRSLVAALVSVSSIHFRPVAQAQQTIVDTARNDGSFTVLVEALEAAGLVGTLSDSARSFTVFAPTDGAFALYFWLQGVTKADLLARSDLGDILRYHVIDGVNINTAVLPASISYTTLEGSDLTVTKDPANGVVKAGNAEVTNADVQCTNGVIHEIDAVLFPPAALDIVDTAFANGYSVFVEALQAAGLESALKGNGPFTVFVPTDAAFTALLQNLGVSKADLLARSDLGDILRYHVSDAGQLLSYDLAAMQRLATLQTKKLTVMKDPNGVVTAHAADSATVSRANVRCSNGVIHVIDAVLLEQNDIMEAAIADGRFTVLVEAWRTTGFDAVMQTDGYYTVFEPTDAAFSVLKATLGVSNAGLLARDDLLDILRYHVTAGKFMSSDLAATQVFTTLWARELTVTKSGNDIFAGSARVTTPDVECYNGVVYVIDAVLLPPKRDIVDTAIADGFTVLVEALQTANLTAALKASGPFTVFAPTDAAFSSLLRSLSMSKEGLLAHAQLRDILLYHVSTAGELLSLNLTTNSSINTLQGSVMSAISAMLAFVKVDVECLNGVIHVIDTVLLPPSFDVSFVTSTTSYVPDNRLDIVDTAIADSRFTVLVEALQTTNLSVALKANGPFTVFAPTDAAFSTLLESWSVSKEQLLAREDLVDILRYHVVSGFKIMSSDLETAQNAGRLLQGANNATVMASSRNMTTLQGSILTMTIFYSSVTVGGVPVITVDVDCTNGVIHVIDAVLVPPNISTEVKKSTTSSAWYSSRSVSALSFLCVFALQVL